MANTTLPKLPMRHARGGDGVAEGKIVLLDDILIHGKVGNRQRPGACVALGGVLVRLVVDPGPPSTKEREWRAVSSAVYIHTKLTC